MKQATNVLGVLSCLLLAVGAAPTAAQNRPPIIDMQNAGFLRDDARLAVIVVSDEEDSSDGPVSLYIDFFRNIKGFANPPSSHT